MDVGLLMEGFILLGSVGFVIAVYFAFRLSRETENERYWLVLALSSLVMAMHQWSMIPWSLHIIAERARLIIQEASAIAGSLLFTYAMYGLYSSMKKIRETTG